LEPLRAWGSIPLSSAKNIITIKDNKMQEENIADADFEEIDDNVQNVEVSADAPKMSKHDVIHALKGAIESGHIDASRAHQIREEMGIFNSDFTKKKVSDVKRKNKRKLQKQARKKQRK